MALSGIVPYMMIANKARHLLKYMAQSKLWEG